MTSYTPTLLDLDLDKLSQMGETIEEVAFSAENPGRLVLASNHIPAKRAARYLRNIWQGYASAVTHASQQAHEIADLTTALAKEREKVKRARSDAKMQAEDIATRVQVILSETRGKAIMSHVIVSPSQFDLLISQNQSLNPLRTKCKMPHVTTLFGLRVVSMAGVYGPVVVTQQAYNAMSRMAPELDTEER